MEGNANEKYASSRSKWSSNNYKMCIDTYIDQVARNEVRHSVDLERLFFGVEDADNGHANEDGDDVDDDNTERDNNVNIDSVGGDDEISRNDSRGKGATSEDSDNGSSERDGASGTSTKASSSTSERGRTNTPRSADQMYRFYARLQKLNEAKPDSEEPTSTGDPVTWDKNRKRIRTALRRLLADRLFPMDAKSKRSKTVRGKSNLADDKTSEDLISGSITPITLDSRSKAAMSLRSRSGDRGTPGSNTRHGPQGRVVFVGEQPNPAVSDGHDKQPLREDMSDGGDHEQPDTYYRRHPLGTLKNGRVSRLYQRPPPANAARWKTSMSQSALRQGLRADATFLQTVKGDQGIRPETRWSVPGEHGPDREPDGQLNHEQSSWRRERPDIAWANNVQPKAGHDPEDGDVHQDRNGMAGHWDDWPFWKLLEELHRDKKYMDKLILTTEQKDKAELEVCQKLEAGRDYLFQRAQFWLEKGPLSPRPPTTEQGYKLQKLRAQAASQTGEPADHLTPNKTLVPTNQSDKSHTSKQLMKDSFDMNNEKEEGHSGTSSHGQEDLARNSPSGFASDKDHSQHYDTHSQEKANTPKSIKVNVKTEQVGDDVSKSHSKDRNECSVHHHMESNIPNGNITTVD